MPAACVLAAGIDRRLPARLDAAGGGLAVRQDVRPQLRTHRRRIERPEGWRAPWRTVLDLIAEALQEIARVHVRRRRFAE
jgi:hypothetical protein